MNLPCCRIALPVASVATRQQENFKFAINAKINAALVGTDLSSFCGVYFSIYGTSWVVIISQYLDSPAYKAYKHWTM